MAETEALLSSDLNRNLAEALARTLRHEVGDFLQKVYASVAILQSRLPPEGDLERDVLARLRKRAEGCKLLLDEVQDFLCPINLSHQEVDLAQVAAALTAAAQEEYPHLEITTEGVAAAPVLADPERIIQVGRALLTNACEAAAEWVVFRTEAALPGGRAAWVITDDGPGATPEAAARLFRPFLSTRPGHAGLGLANARKVVLLHGGQVTAGNLPAGGFQVRVDLPADRDQKNR